MKSTTASIVASIVLSLFIGGLLGASIMANALDTGSAQVAASALPAADNAGWLGFWGAIIGAAATIMAGAVAWLATQSQIKVLTSEHRSRQIRVLRLLDSYLGEVSIVAHHNHGRASGRATAALPFAMELRPFPAATALSHEDIWRIEDGTVLAIEIICEMSTEFDAKLASDDSQYQRTSDAALKIYERCERVRPTVTATLRELGASGSYATLQDDFVELRHRREKVFSGASKRL